MKITDRIEITNEDNMDLMARYPDKHFDLAIVDPPYGIGESGKNHKSRNTLVRQKDGIRMRRCPSTSYIRKDWDDEPAGGVYFKELQRVTRNQIVFGGNYFKELMLLRKPPRREDYQAFLKLYPYGIIVWDKVNGSNDFNDCEIIWTSFDFPSFVLPYMWAGMMQGVSILSGTVMQGNKNLNEKRIHPTQKPVVLYKWLLSKYAKQGDRILDTHLGSGSIAIACHDFGFELTACELDKDYYKAAIERIKKHTAQGSLFRPEELLTTQTLFEND